LIASHRIYDQDLECKGRADMIRNSLQILETYKSLIYFPQNVDKFLKTDDYEQILTSYKQCNIQLAKAEPATRKSRLFAQIKTDLDNKILDVQQHILKKLVQFPSNPDEQKFLIDYYNAIHTYSSSVLTPAGLEKLSNISPAWYCLEEEKKWFIQLMIECRDMHIADEKVSLALKQSNSDESSSSNKANSNSNNNNQNNKNNKLMSVEASKIQAMTPVPHERNKFIEELCEMFFDIFSDYWRLGTMFLNNLLTVNNSKQKNTSKNSDSLSTSSAKVHTSENYYELVAEILSTFSDIIRAAFIPHTFNNQTDSTTEKTNLLLPWPIQHDAKIISQILPHCLRVCR
jgi:hypothetical protein